MLATIKLSKASSDTPNLSLKETKSKIFNLETKERSEYKSVQNQNPHEKVANTYTEDQKRSLQQWWLPDNK